MGASLKILVLLLQWLALINSQEQVIETNLVAKWSPTSLLSEAAEYIADSDQSLFWPYVETVLQNVATFPGASDDNLEKDIARVACLNLISPAKIRFLDWVLSARQYSPKVLTLQQLAPESVSAECKNKEVFVTLENGQSSCDLNELKSMLEGNLLKTDEKPWVLESDHKYPSSVWQILDKPERPSIVVLYANLARIESNSFHEILKKSAILEQIGYILRPFKKESTEKLELSGYGVELQFKSTEYKAQDETDKKDDEGQEVGGFMFDSLLEKHGDLTEQLHKFQNYLASVKGKKAEFEALKAWQVQELGLQASHFTTLQADILTALLDVSGNFPSKAAFLSSIRVPNGFKRAINRNQLTLTQTLNIDEGEGAFFLQGNYIDPDSLDLFAFMDNLKWELHLMELTKSLFHDEHVTNEVIKSKILQIGSKSSSELELALDLRDSSIYWINDLEKDEEYEDWPNDLSQLFFRLGGVMLRPVRRNVFNLVLTLDPDDISTTFAMLKMAQSFMAHKAPVRVGVVLSSSSEKSSESDSVSGIVRKVLNFAISEGRIKKGFNEVVNAFQKNKFESLLQTFPEANDDFDYGWAAAKEFIKKSGRPAPGAYLNGVPLKWDSIDDFEETILSQLLKEAQSVQIDSYNKKISQDTDIFEYLMSKPNVQTRLNDKILNPANLKFLNFGTEMWDIGKSLKHRLAHLSSKLNYLSTDSASGTRASVSLWVFSDLDSSEGRSFLQTALEFLEESSRYSRIAVIPTSPINSFVEKFLNTVADNDLQGCIKLLKTFENSNVDGDQKSGNYAYIEEIMKLTGVGALQKAVVVNGKIIDGIENDKLFERGDWSLLEKHNFESCAKNFHEETLDSNSVMRICSTLMHPTVKSLSSKRYSVPKLEQPYSGNLKEQIEKDEKASNDEVDYDVNLLAVIDPASRNANKMASILLAVRDIVGEWVKISIIFNPPSKHSELPLKSYYRYITGHDESKTVVFDNIPVEPLFTQNLIAPDNWMVEVVSCVHDLDNIRLRDVKGTIESSYELEFLLVEGHCVETKSGSPPRGLQFTLNSRNSETTKKVSETIVMANLGYFQLKAEPGVWDLGLRDGPSKEIYSIEVPRNKPIIVDSFQSFIVKVKVKSNSGKETASLLDTEEENSSSWFNFGSKRSDAEDDTINVFSLASGHLYERLLKIMMLSVLKNTKSKVKFWFLKNYLSPTLKDVLPHMAEHYGFEYELVQYHWPRWLNAQREKQRTIWGYKILFLDVLFPLSLKKIVFVDADQIVRTDLKELFEFDLEGNPYGYTPFCDSRTEMDGFRFWKQGYWRSHLGRRKYHISALYVVDLVRFRRIAAGDRLRGQYQALSQDPNSLSNLDQDLPNNMIHQVGIKSLPQEWLWCETWCDDASKKYAKTIDLCNNPMTKEPKLEAAQRIVPEWKTYDQEIKEFQQKLWSRQKVEEEAKTEPHVHEEF